MKQNLENYLKENRLKLDVDEPDKLSIWEGIKSGAGKKKTSLPDWFWKAAAIFLFLISATYFVVNETKQEKVILVSLSDLSKDLGNQEAELQQQVKLKMEAVKREIPEDNSDFLITLAELNNLDTLYNTYQKDLNNTFDNEPVIRAMLDHYEKKIKILNRLLLEIEKEKRHEETITL